jgi:YfiH family protein
LVTHLLPNEPIWLDQVHGTQIWTPRDPQKRADGAVSDQIHDVLCIMTADCMPILFCDEAGEILGAAHGGWRGLSLGIIKKTIDQMLVIKRPDSVRDYLSQIQIYFGPTIGPNHFEVGEEVRAAFMHLKLTEDMRNCFRPLDQEGKYLANLFQIARIQCQSLGLENIFSEEICCYEHSDLFFSHRRDRVSGRFATFLWKTL